MKTFHSLKILSGPNVFIIICQSSNKSKKLITDHQLRLHYLCYKGNQSRWPQQRILSFITVNMKCSMLSNIATCKQSSSCVLKNEESMAYAPIVYPLPIVWGVLVTSFAFWSPRFDKCQISSKTLHYKFWGHTSNFIIYINIYIFILVDKCPFFPLFSQCIFG